MWGSLLTLQDLLGVGGEGHFESRFFTFRRSVQSLERQLGREIGAWLQRSPSLQAKLRIVELFACTSRRETVRVSMYKIHTKQNYCETKTDSSLGDSIGKTSPKMLCSVTLHLNNSL